MVKPVADRSDRGILLVDDDQNFLNMTAGMFSEAGFSSVFTATSAAEAISLLAEKGDSIYVVVLDLYMEERNSGLGVVKHLTNVHQHHVGIIIYTGYASNESEEHFFEMESGTVHALRYIEKGYHSPKHLIREVERALDAIYDKRSHVADGHAKEVLSRLDAIEKQLSSLAEIPGIREHLERLSRRQAGFLQQLGLDLLRIIIIALAVLALLSVGASDFLRKVLGLGS